MKECKPIVLRKAPGHVPLESSISSKILKFLNAIPNCKAVKRHQAGFNRRGDPDIFGCIYGRHFEFETKRPNKKCTVLQEQRIREWVLAGAIAGRVESVFDVIAIFRKHGIEV